MRKRAATVMMLTETVEEDVKEEVGKPGSGRGWVKVRRSEITGQLVGLRQMA